LRLSPARLVGAAGAKPQPARPCEGGSILHRPPLDATTFQRLRIVPALHAVQGSTLVSDDRHLPLHDPTDWRQREAGQITNLVQVDWGLGQV